MIKDIFSLCDNYVPLKNFIEWPQLASYLEKNQILLQFSIMYHPLQILYKTNLQLNLLIFYTYDIQWFSINQALHFISLVT